jgi:hypothetical protein
MPDAETNRFTASLLRNAANAGARGSAISLFRLKNVPPTASGCHFKEAGTSVRHRFWAALGQGNLLDRASTYYMRTATPSEFDAA